MPSDSPIHAHSLDAALAARVEALLRDPRGQFCPRPVVLCVLQGSHPEQIVMQVGEDAQGRVQVLTATPLSDGVEYGLCDESGPSDRPNQVYVLDSTREGLRPEDAGARCWINTLSTVQVPPPQGDNSP